MIAKRGALGFMVTSVFPRRLAGHPTGRRGGPLARPLNESYPNRMSLNAEHVAPRDSWLARRDARWRLAAFGLSIVVVALLRDVGPTAVALGFALLLAFLARIPGRWYRSRI